MNHRSILFWSIVTLILIAYQNCMPNNGFKVSEGQSPTSSSLVGPEEESSQPAPSPSPSTQLPTPQPMPNPQPVPGLSELSASQLLSDMSKAHESTVHGVNPAWDWGSKPRLGWGVNFPTSFNDPHVVPWGIVASASSGSSAPNTRVQIRKLILDIKRDGAWTRLVFNSNDNSLMGSLYTNYETNESAPANLRKHGVDGISVKLPEAGGSFHFMTTNRFRLERGAQEVVARLEARLIIDDSNKADDRSAARILVTASADYWKNATQQWNPNELSNVDFAIGRFKFVTRDWAVFTAHTLETTVEAEDYLANESKLNPR